MHYNNNNNIVQNKEIDKSIYNSQYNTYNNQQQILNIRQNKLH